MGDNGRGACILGWGGYIPLRRFDITELVRRREKDKIDYYRHGLWAEEKAIPGLDEDTITIGWEAARNAVRRAEIDGRKIEASFFGRESGPYAVGSSGLQVAAFFESCEHLKHVADLELACNSGMEAVNICRSYVESGEINCGLAVGADISGGAEGDPLEILVGCGSGSFVIGKNGSKRDVAALIVDVVGNAGLEQDFWRREGQPNPAHFGETTKRAYMHRVLTSTRKMLEKHGITLNHFRWITCHSPYAKLVEQTFRPVSVIQTFLHPNEITEELRKEMKENPEVVVKRAEEFSYLNKYYKKFVLNSLKILTLSEAERKEKIHPTLLSRWVGNSYAGNTPLNLAHVLDMAEPGQDILAISYGSWAASLATWVRTLPGLDKKKGLAPSVKSLLERRKMLNWKDYYLIKIRRIREYLRMNRPPKRVIGEIQPLEGKKIKIQICHGCKRVYFPAKDLCIDEKCPGFNDTAILETKMYPSRAILKSFKKRCRVKTYKIYAESKAIITDTYPPYLVEGVELEAIVRKIDEEGDEGQVRYGIVYRAVMGAPAASTNIKAGV
ncbi:MAG: hydroxymethylglutaryl-CoA synthase [Candidatus Bathyarchaeia archaeon]